MAFGVMEGLSVLSGVGGLLGASAARRRAQEEQRKALVDFSRSLDMELNALKSSNAQGLSLSTGRAADAINALSRNMGASLAAGGVSDSSSVAGAVTSAQANAQQALAQAAMEDQSQEQQLVGRNQRSLAEMKMGLAGSNLNMANNEMAGARSGLQSFLQGLAQKNLRKTGVVAPQSLGLPGNGKNNATLPNVADIVGPLPFLGPVAGRNRNVRPDMFANAMRYAY